MFGSLKSVWVFVGILVVAPGALWGMTADEHRANLDRLLGTMQENVDAGPYRANAESLNSYPVPDWYVDGKFGIFIHWGLFSVPAYSGVGCWYGNNMYDPRWSVFDFHRETFGPQNRFGYKDFAPGLTGARFDADDWVRLFKEAGAKFVVPVSCFHDGFAMWDSRLTDWNAVKMGPRFDYDRELAAAARRQGLKFGVSWHAFMHAYFFNPGTRIDSDVKPPNMGPAWSIYGPALDVGAPLPRDFVEDCLGRLTELVDGYRPDLVWFDRDTQYVPPEDLRKFAAFYFNRSAQWNTGVVINDKNPGLFPDSVTLDIERGKIAGLQHKVWQTDTSVSWKDWSYIQDDSFKPTNYLIRELVDIVSKNGVLLLDVGPRADGTIPTEPRAILRGIGAWLKINGEAIYGTRPCWALGYGEGRHNSGGGESADSMVEYDSHDFRFTQKGNAIYAIAMEWPERDEGFLIKSLGDENCVASGGIDGVSLLGSAETIDWEQTDEGLRIKRPSARPCDAAYAFKIVMHGLSAEKLAAERIDEHQMQLDVQVRNLDSSPVDQVVTFFDNGKVIGTARFSLGALESKMRRLQFEVDRGAGTETITAAVADGKPFVARDVVVGSPGSRGVFAFDGNTMFRASGIGELERLTFSVWARSGELPDDYSALLNTVGWERGGMHIQYLPSGKLQVSFKGEAGVVSERQSQALPAETAGWDLITVVFDKHQERAIIYVNGKRDTEIYVNQASPVNLNAFTIGGWSVGGRRFKGWMADMRIYDRVLTEDEIRGMLDGAAPSEGLVAAWDMGTGRDGAIRDVSGHGRDAVKGR